MIRFIFLLKLLTYSVSGADYDFRIAFPDEEPELYEACDKNGVNATCVDIRRCPTALDHYADGNMPQICSFNETFPVVCCEHPRFAPVPLSSIPVPTVRLDDCQRRLPVVRHTGDKAVDKCNEYIARLLHPCVRDKKGRWVSPDLCKVPGEELIVGSGGVDAERYQYRHMALLLYGEDATPDVFCGGSVLSERYVLTAAHCASSSERGKVTTVVTGILRISDPQEMWRRNKVKNFIKHPDYDPPNKYHDIALVETDEDIKLDSVVVPICVHTGSEAVSERAVLATGWGALGPHRENADTLQEIQLTKMDKCHEVYRKHRHLKQGFDNRTQMCFGDLWAPRDTCQGDSGGPVQVETGRCRMVALGVTSFGRQCGAVGVPAVYTRVQHYAPWIVDIVWPN